MIRLFLGIACATALFVAVAQAQTSSTTTTTTGGTETTTTTETTGTITEFTPGASLVLSTGAAEPVHYKFSKTVTYVTPSGDVIEASKVKKNSRVRVHYIKQGNDIMVDRVVVLD
jgi:hypothetical protein